MLILCWMLACGGQNSKREEASLLLERIARVDLNGSFAAREQQIAALRGLKLSYAELYAVRERCVQAHAGLLAAERQQELARVQIAQAEDAGRRDPAEVVAIAASLADAAKMLRGAHAALPECEKRARELLLGRK